MKWPGNYNGFMDGWMDGWMTWITISKGQIMEDCMKRITTRKRTDHGELYDKDHDKEKGK